MKHPYCKRSEIKAPLCTSEKNIKINEIHRTSKHDGYNSIDTFPLNFQITDRVNDLCRSILKKDLTFLR